MSARDTGFNKTDSPSRNLIPLEGYCEWSDSAGSSKSLTFFLQIGFVTARKEARSICSCSPRL